MDRLYQGDFYLGIDLPLCKGCGLCVSSCPARILYLNNKNKIAVKDISECIFCGICEARCPDFAIWVFKNRQATEQVYNAHIRTCGEVTG
jgi:2-oxoglutarate ferredoxin oxidoreductase subunit delta